MSISKHPVLSTPTLPATSTLHAGKPCKGTAGTPSCFPGHRDSVYQTHQIHGHTLWENEIHLETVTTKPINQLEELISC